ncbi:MAG: tetratricopeptide repeat protein [Acidobacteriota bacterium]|nr:tetratricopeptide repeat protein [Acidobacteriota bacterium]
MAKSMGCARRTFVGCLGCSGILVLLVLFLGLGVAINQPEVPEFTSIDEHMAVEEIHEKAGAVPPGGDQPSKPIRLFIGTSMAEVDIFPGAEPGRVNVEGRYDKANFKLKREIEERDNYIEYRIDLVPKTRPWFYNTDFNDENRLKIVLPRETPLALTVRGNTGTSRIRLGGLALEDADIAHTAGRLDVHMSRPNPVEMEFLRIKSTMGEANIYDAQNFRFARARLKGTMGGMRISNSGDFMRDADIDLKMTMGQSRLELPENVRLEATTRAVMGESRAPRRRKEGKTRVIRLSGKVTMGEQKVFYRTRSPKKEGKNQNLSRLRKLVENISQDENVGEVLDEVLALVSDAEAMGLSRQQLDKLGKRLMEDEHLEEALRLFRINAERFPEYAGVHDSLGEALARSGRIEEAVEALKRSLELDADNDYTRALLKKLKARIPEQ